MNRSYMNLMLAMILTLTVMGTILMIGGRSTEAISNPTSRVSVDSLGGEGNNDSHFPSIADDGSVVSFTSSASNLIPDDTNGSSDVFVHDRLSGVTTRVSISSTGEQGNDSSVGGTPCGGSRFIVFASSATNLVPDDTNGQPDVFIHDRLNGITTRVSISSDGVQGNGASIDHAASVDCRFIAFISGASNFVPGDTNNRDDVFVHDRQTGVTGRLSFASSGAQANNHSYFPAISDNGRLVAFASSASNLVPGDSNASIDVFVHDRHNGTTNRVSVSSSGAQANGESYHLDISGSGRFVTFGSSASNLVWSDTNGMWDIFVRDLLGRTTDRVSISSFGEQANNTSWDPSLSSDGRFVVFQSGASNLISYDTNSIEDVFVHDRENRATSRVSIGGNCGEGNGLSWYSKISGDGRFVTFESYSSNLVPSDENDAVDIFLHDRANAAIVPVSCLYIPVVQR